MAALSGVAAAAAGGLVGGLVGLGIPEYEAKAYEERIKKGGFLMAVHVDDNKNARMTFAKSWRGMVSRTSLRCRRNNRSKFVTTIQLGCSSRKND